MTKYVEPIHDPYSIGPTFVDGLSVIEAVGPVTHLVFTSRQTPVWQGSKPERIVQCRLVVPTDQLITIARQLLAGRVDEHGPVDYEGEPLPLN